ncbi:HNH/ENDO VII family nuclease [Synergistaceae bacterium OttesenSCG-928-D05]|nr:HNH/ENDO VII family nuclease [Synergistaceae bacterium OttesenSCG-928-D05]
MDKVFGMFSECLETESALSKLAESMKDLPLDIAKLDVPILYGDTHRVPEDKESDGDDINTSPETNETQNEGLAEEEKQQIEKESGWSKEIIDAIGSMAEYEIYKNAGLQEAEINGKKCLIRSDIDMNQKDADGMTNKERMEKGLSPLTKSGETVELHHIGQRSDGPLAELTTKEHRGTGNDTILHDKTKESEIDRNQFATERREHWQNRADQQ